MDKQEIILLNKFINNQCTLEELAQVDELIKKGVPEEIWLQLMDEATIEKQITILSHSHHEKLYTSIQQKIAPLLGKHFFLNTNRKWSIGIAASLLILMIAFAGFYLTKQPQPIVLTQLSKESQRQYVQTSDGSEIWINNQSSLEYPELFRADRREVKLNGEAFFEVTKDTNRPFIVNTQNLSVRVLGTSFNVKSYHEDSEIIITLAIGKVQVEVEGKTESLTPGEQLIYSKAKKVFIRMNIDPTETYAWREGWLLFNSATLVDIAKTIERAYGVKINIEGERLKKTKVTLKLKNENIKSVLEVLAFSSGFQYEIADNVVTIKPEKK